MECGYCLQESTDLVDPRFLPCRHVHCYPCLVGEFNEKRIVKCGKCKSVHDVTLDRLQSATEHKQNIQMCDVCTEKGTTDQLAVNYCPSCNRSMCLKHLEFHQEFQPLHTDIVNIGEYVQKKEMLEIRNCTKHDTRQIVLGCPTCLHVFCTSCMDGEMKCVNGAQHRVISLEELVQKLKTKRDSVKVEAHAKEEKFLELLKSCTQVLSNYESKTEELIQRLHNTKEEQLSELRQKYDALEMELKENRRRSKTQLVEFLEQEIGVRLTEMNTLLMLQDSRFSHAHQVDVVSQFADTNKEINRFISEDLPCVTLSNQLKLSAKGRWRDIELETVEDADIKVIYEPLQEFVDRFTTSMSSEPSYLEEPTVWDDTLAIGVLSGSSRGLAEATDYPTTSTHAAAQYEVSQPLRLGDFLGTPDYPTTSTHAAAQYEVSQPLRPGDFLGTPVKNRKGKSSKRRNARQEANE